MKRILTFLFLLVVGANVAAADTPIKIVGSSTVFPFAVTVGEQFGTKTSYKTPIIESTGSGGGIKLFCAGTGPETPSVTNASRRIKKKELQACHDHGVKTVVEFRFGFDGIVVASSINGITMNLTLAELYNALKRGSKAVKWSDVNQSLPNLPIRVLGPPATSGTRDAFEELVMDGGCIEAGHPKKECKHVEIRNDGPWVDAGENDTVIVNKLSVEQNSVGVFGFSFLDNNRDKLKGASINGSLPTFDNISVGSYPLSRSLYFYVKFDHFQYMPALRPYIEEWAKEGTIGPDGYLVDKGLIPLPENDRKKFYKHVISLTPLRM